jgi:hypothetical protein
MGTMQIANTAPPAETRIRFTRADPAWTRIPFIGALRIDKR